MEVEQRRGLITFFALTFALGGIAGLAGPGDWYADLIQPANTPPGWLLLPIWSVLYTAIALAGWLVWREVGAASLPIALWSLLLTLSVGWWWLFFGFHQLGLAFAELSLVLVVVVATIAVFSVVHFGAGLLLVPYLLWISFATLNTYMLWRLNP